MKTLNEADIIQAMREEWNSRVKSVVEQANLTLTSKVDGSQDLVIAPELKVRHKKSQIRYTVDSVGPRDVILRTPEGETFLVNKEEFEQAYELD